LGTFPVKAQTSIGDLQQNLGVTIAVTISNIVGNKFIIDDGTGKIIVDARPRRSNLCPKAKILVILSYVELEIAQ
jgi:hypothetical protein